jgi:WW domain-containing oxidoreductase
MLNYPVRRGMNRRCFLAKAGAVAAVSAIHGRLEAGVPPSPFNAMSTAEEVTEGIDLSGRTALVTGCNSGIGLETMRVLALRGARVFGAARTLAKAETACASVTGRTTPVTVELTDPDSIAATAAMVKKEAGVLDMLILNAGVMALPERRLAYGVEFQFGVNHLGHFLLANHLQPLIEASSAGRVAVVSSELHRQAPEAGILFDNLTMEGVYNPMLAYGHSKLANILFANELALRLEGTRATANSLHPGVIKTGLARHLPDEMRDADWDDRGVSEGAATSCYVATSPSLEGVSGYYFADCNVAVPSEHAQDVQMARRLWSVSEALLANYLV